MEHLALLGALKDQGVPLSTCALIKQDMFLAASIQHNVRRSAGRSMSPLLFNAALNMLIIHCSPAWKMKRSCGLTRTADEDPLCLRNDVVQ